MNSEKKILSTGIIGMGGFAAAHHRAINELEKKGMVKLCCTCDIAPENFKQMIENLCFEKRGVEIFDNYLKMLDGCEEKLDFVTIPTPIPLHAEMHQQCVKKQIPVYLEKPPTLDYQQFISMMEVEQYATKQTNVGFNFIIQKLRHRIKQRILSNEFGNIKKITFMGQWPRPSSYFRRSSWAGKLKLNNDFVLDSCFGNAISHYVHNILFWCGKGDIFSWDPVEEVHAELYRTHDIQGTDTVFAIASTRHVNNIRIALTHACAEKTRDIEKIYCENAEIHFEGNATGNNGYCAQCTIYWNNRQKEMIEEPYENLLRDNIEYYARYLLGEHQRPLILLSDTEPFVLFNGLIYVAAKKITQIPEQSIERINLDNGDYFLSIKNIKEIAQKFIETGKFPSEQNIQWARSGGHAKCDQIKDLHRIIWNIIS